MNPLSRPSFEQAPQTTQATKTMTTSAPPATTTLTTGVVRGSYCNLFTPRAPDPKKPDEPPKFGMTLLIPKEDTLTLNKIEAAKQLAIEQKWGTKRPAKIDFTLHDGDGVRPQSGEPFGDECKGHMVIAVQTKFRLKILDVNRNEIIDPNAVGSGDYFKAQISLYAYDSNGRKGVSAGLQNVLFVSKGDSLGGRQDAESAFADDFVKVD